jgi:hypothetical protein
MSTPCPIVGSCPKPCPTQPTCARVDRRIEQDHVWLGDLAGFEVVPVLTDDWEIALELRHRCGWSMRLRFDGITGDGAAFLGNIVQVATEERPGHVCADHSHG